MTAIDASSQATPVSTSSKGGLPRRHVDGAKVGLTVWSIAVFVFLFLPIVWIVIFTLVYLIK